MDHDFVLSIEQECHSILENESRERDGDFRERLGTAPTLGAFFERLREIAPTLAGPGGLFTPYGRLYMDCGDHLELAAIECDDPYLLAVVCERQQVLVSRVVKRLASEGHELWLANNNHSGILQPETSTWGTHENYLVNRPPTEFTDEIVPFLVSRIYAGSGGVLFPGAEFLAAVRPVFMEQVLGGSTTHQRAIHSMCREEHHMGPDPQRYRYHQILGDGHASQFNLALMVGATALALKAIDFDKKILDRVAAVAKLPYRGCWVQTLHRFNRLAKPGRTPKVDPAVVEIQRIYWDAATRYYEALEEPPSWIPRLLEEWDSVLTAFAKNDLDWLAARLDAFIKYDFYSAILEGSGRSWKSLVNQEQGFAELALLDQSYHAFSDPESVFKKCEKSGHVAHRVAPYLEPGGEDEPWVPPNRTRASARARFIVENAGEPDLVVNWDYVARRTDSFVRRLDDPFAEEFGPWENGASAPRLEEMRALLSRRRRRG